ncbi:DinB family protein [Mycolicibacterium komossense]|uniref:DinB family protein n=1 Tax=Mycolicibacterium komossense TaxID=1779 RepID=A0ABT3CDI2_9MYCO|nr:DinB family protein [Mycolicibacterium komossense]MCV7227507.1 DinB family protein [Mycolicibacterium komossense]
MPAMPPPVADERQGLRDYLTQQQYAYHALAFGLTDEQARATPTVSALSIGALIKHATGVQRTWMQRVAAAPQAPPDDDRPTEQRQAEYVDEFVMKPDETLAEILTKFEAVNAETLRVTESADLSAAIPVPRDAPWFPKDIEAWSVRWVLFHMIEELARHAGHGDIIRESIDGATMYELLAGLEDWEPTSWLTPWGKAPVSG